MIFEILLREKFDVLNLVLTCLLLLFFIESLFWAFMALTE